MGEAHQQKREGTNNAPKHDGPPSCLSHDKRRTGAQSKLLRNTYAASAHVPRDQPTANQVLKHLVNRGWMTPFHPLMGANSRCTVQRRLRQRGVPAVHAVLYQRIRARDTEDGAVPIRVKTEKVFDPTPAISA